VHSTSTFLFVRYLLRSHLKQPAGCALVAQDTEEATCCLCQHLGRGPCMHVHLCILQRCSSVTALSHPRVHVPRHGCISEHRQRWLAAPQLLHGTAVMSHSRARSSFCSHVRYTKGRAGSRQPFLHSHRAITDRSHLCLSSWGFFPLTPLPGAGCALQEAMFCLASNQHPQIHHSNFALCSSPVWWQLESH